MNGPCFLPSGRRLAPYFERRCETSLVSKPFWGLVFSRRRTSSVAMACQAGTSLMGLAIAAASIYPLHNGYIGRLPVKWSPNFFAYFRLARCYKRTVNDAIFAFSNG